MPGDVVVPYTSLASGVHGGRTGFSLFHTTHNFVVMDQNVPERNVFTGVRHHDTLLYITSSYCQPKILLLA